MIQDEITYTLESFYNKVFVLPDSNRRILCHQILVPNQC